MRAPWRPIVTYKGFGFEIGPTIPFILGALRHPIGSPATPKVSREELHDLLVAMRDDPPEPACVEILRCTDIGAYVARWRDSPPVGRHQIDSAVPGRALYHADIDGYQVHDLESLMEALWDIHKDAISSCSFSRDRQAWRPFDDAEQRRIMAALADHA